MFMNQESNVYMCVTYIIWFGKKNSQEKIEECETWLVNLNTLWKNIIPHEVLLWHLVLLRYGEIWLRFDEIWWNSVRFGAIQWDMVRFCKIQ